MQITTESIEISDSGGWHRPDARANLAYSLSGAVFLLAAATARPAFEAAAVRLAPVFKTRPRDPFGRTA